MEPAERVKEQAERVNKILDVVEKSLERIHAEAESFHRKADSERRYHTWFSAALAVLGVAAPTLVTYQIQSKDGSGLALIAILLTAIVGAASALQATFRWSDRFRRTSLTALALDELESSTRLELYDIRDTGDDMKVYHRAYE